MRPTDVLVPLNGGTVLPASVIARAIDLEARGIRLRRDEDGYLIATPKSAITPDDDCFLKAHRDDLLTLVAYVERVVSQ